MTRYRVKSKQCYTFGISSELCSVKYSVQVKFPWIPYWFQVSRPFNTLNDAKEHIKLKLDEQFKGE